MIIPVKDDATRLDLCLDALSRQTFEGGYEVIVGDNGSSDDPEAVVAKYPFARLVYEPEHGSYAARNAAVKEAKGEIFAFTDADCIPTETWLANGAERLEEVGEHSWIGGKIQLFPVNPERLTPGEAYGMCHGFPQRRSVEEQKWSATANMLTWRTAFEHAGPFQQTFISSGDREWGNRATDKGVKGHYFEDVEVRHPCRGELRELRTKNIRMLKGDIQMRQQQGRPLMTTREFALAIAPPIPSIMRNWKKVQPANARTRLTYLRAIFYLTYARLFDRVRLVSQERKRQGA